jgi:hypothetical protein
MTPMPVRSPWSVVRRAALHLLARLTHQRAPHVARSASFGLELNIGRCTALATGNRGPRFAPLPPLGQHDQLGARNVRVSLVLHLDPIRAAPGPIRLAAAFGDDAFQAQAAGVGERERAVAVCARRSPSALARAGSFAMRASRTSAQRSSSSFGLSKPQRLGMSIGVASSPDHFGRFSFLRGMIGTTSLVLKPP